MKSLRLISFTLLLLSIPGKLIATTTSTTMQVRATVISNCLLDADTLNFGTYDPAINHASTPLNAKGAIRIKCTRNTGANVTIDTGKHAAKTMKASRALANSKGSDFLGYELYTDNSHSSTWNNVNKVAYSAANGDLTTINVYGSIPANQGVHDGVYTDTVTVVATF